MGVEANSLPELWTGIITTFVALGGAIAGAAAYFKKPKGKAGGEMEVAVVSAALFSDKTLMLDLVAAIRENTSNVKQITLMMEKELERRDDEHRIRQILAEHGIKGQGNG